MQPTMIFDLDGTLVDSVPDLASAVNRLMALRSLAGFRQEEIAAMVGDGARVLLERAFAARGLASDEAALAHFLTDYGANAAVASTAFPGVVATLAEFAGQGWRMAVCTNKPEAPARSLLAALGIDHHFAAVGGGDSYPVRKPDPGHLRATIEAAGATGSRCVMVGDHHNDIVAATGVGIPCIFAAWGYGPPETGDHAAATARQFGELPGLAARLVGKA